MIVKPFVRDARTDADVQRILDTIGDVQPDGRMVLHETCEQALGTRRSDPHYWSVMGHVRRRLEVERGIVLDGRGQQGKGWLVLTPTEQVSRGHVGVKHKLRLAHRDLHRMAMPKHEELPEAQAVFRAAFVTSMTRVFADAEVAQRSAKALPGPVRSRPARPAE